MISHRQSSKQRRITLIIACGILAVLFLQTPLASLGVSLTPIDSWSRGIERTIPGVWSWFYDRFAGFDAVRHERDAALHERDRARAELAWLTASIPDYEALRAIRSSSTRNRIIASVVSTPNESPYDSLIIDKGERDGVQKGALVFSEYERALGTIVDMRETSSVVMLFSSPGVRSLVYSTSVRTFARATGMGGGTLMVLMPHGSAVAPGDTFIMPTISGEPIGIVERVWSDPAEPGVLAAVTASTSLRSLRFVTIDTKPFVVPTTDDIRAAMSAHATSTESLFMLPDTFASSTIASSTP